MRFHYFRKRSKITKELKVQKNAFFLIIPYHPYTFFLKKRIVPRDIRIIHYAPLTYVLKYIGTCTTMYVVREFSMKGRRSPPWNPRINANSTHVRAREYTIVPRPTCILCVFGGQPQSRRATTWDKSSVFSSRVVLPPSPRWYITRP